MWNWKHRSVLMIVGLVLLALVAIQRNQAQERAAATQDSAIPRETKEQPMSYWMDRKLEHSKSRIESLTKADFEALERDAERLRLLGKMEGLVRRRNEDYRAQLRTFDIAVTELVRQSRRQNSEGAVLAFNQLTTSCVACHILLREGVE